MYVFVINGNIFFFAYQTAKKNRVFLIKKTKVSLQKTEHVFEMNGKIFISFLFSIPSKQSQKSKKSKSKSE